MSRPPFETRGILEGFYGRPWSHRQRLDMISFIAELGMNTFVYTPKDDPLLRRDWRLPVEGAGRQRLAELIDACRARGVRFVYCISPGLSMEYSADADVECLVSKFLSVAELGVDEFGLLFDDIPLELQHPADAVFPDVAAAHAAVSTAVYARLPSRARLVICPTVYWGRGDEEYVVRLGQRLDPRIDIFWTGRAICSPTIECLDAAVLARSTARLPLYWDNYPVNDVAMTDELHVGPYRGRDPHLGHFAVGVVANGMELAESSKIAFATVADYLRDPEGYDPEASWSRAIRRVAGEELAHDYAVFADNVRGSCLSELEAPNVAAALSRFLFRLERDPLGAGSDLGEFALRLAASADRLLGEAAAGHALIEEGRRWIEKFAAGARVMQRMAELARSGAPVSAWTPELLSLRARLRAMPERVFGAAIDMTLTDLLSMAEETP